MYRCLTVCGKHKFNFYEINVHEEDGWVVWEAYNFLKRNYQLLPRMLCLFIFTVLYERYTSTIWAIQFLCILVSTWYFLILAVLIDVYLIRVSIFISLVVNDVEHLYMCLFAIHLFISVKCLFMSFSFASFLTELFFYCWVSTKILIYSRSQSFVKYMVL